MNVSHFIGTFRTSDEMLNNRATRDITEANKLDAEARLDLDRRWLCGEANVEAKVRLVKQLELTVGWSPSAYAISPSPSYRRPRTPIKLIGAGPMSSSETWRLGTAPEGSLLVGR